MKGPDVAGVAKLGALSGRGWTVFTVALGATCAFTLRLVIPYEAVLGGDSVELIGTDAWYHMRLVDALVQNFPHRVWFDPYLRHPGGDAVHVGPFFDWVVAGVALVLGGGSPGERLLDEVGALAPAVFGALTVVPVYVLGRELFSRRAGLWAAGLVGILPGEILTRSLVGAADHHCAEVLLSTVALMFFVLSLGRGRSRRAGLTFSALGGVALGCYLLTWSGGALLVTILVAWATAHMVIERCQGKQGDAVERTVVPAFLVAGLMVLPWARSTPQFTLQLVALGGGLLAIGVLHFLAKVTRGANHGLVVYLGGVLATGATVGGVISWVAPGLTASAVDQVMRLRPDRTVALASEAQPLMTSTSWGPIPLWDQFTTSLFLAAVGLGAAFSTSRRHLLFLVWTSGMVLATIGQIRFAYYLAINVALSAGLACDMLVGWVQSRVSTMLGTSSTWSTSHAGTAPPSRWPVRAGLCAGIGLATLLVTPNIGIYHAMASRLPVNTTSIWIDAMRWLRFNTPDPFGDPELYYASFDTRASLEVATRASSRAAYGVMAWWDYGYQMIRVGRRVPTANPKQGGVRDAAAFFLSEDESAAVDLADTLGVRYVFVNGELQARLGSDGRARTGFIENMADALGTSASRYVRIAYKTTASGLEPVILYEPAYYRTMMSRLYLAGHAPPVSGQTVWVVTLEERTWNDSRYWELVSEIPFANHEEARGVVEAARSPNVRLVGKDPFVSCIPLPPLQHFARVYGSLDLDRYRDHIGPSVVQIFERAR